MSRVDCVKVVWTYGDNGVHQLMKRMIGSDV